MKRKMVGLVLVVGFLTFVSLLKGQSTAVITGRLVDGTGGVLPGALVTVMNVGTGGHRVVTSDDRGYYTVPLLGPGDYEITVQLAGFQTVTRSGVRLAVNQAARIDFILEVGRITDKVEVVGSAPVVDPQTGTVGTVVERQNLQNLPMNQRNAYGLAFLVPGVSPSTADQSLAPAANNQSVDVFMVNGGRIKESAFLLDGADNTAGLGYERTAVSSMPPVEAIEEFKIQTSTYSAEFGRSAGGVLNMVMKSGTIKFHGSLYDFVRNSALDANNFFANRARTRLASFKRNQFGANLGGPIFRDRAFFFFSYEGLRSRQATTLTATLPTERQRQGDFSETFAMVAGTCQPVQIFDPTTTRPNPNGPGLIRDPFRGNVIPSNRIDPLALRMVGLYPAPNQVGAACTGANNFFSQKTSPQSSNQIDTRVDWRLGGKDDFFASFNWRQHELDPPTPKHYGTLGEPAGNVTYRPGRGFRINHTRAQSPRFLLNFRFGYNHAAYSQDALGVNITDLGFPQILYDQMTTPTNVPYFSTLGYGALGTSMGFANLYGTTYNYAGNATWVKGKHSIKFGGEARDMISLEYVGFGSTGSYSFDRTYTQGPNPLVSKSGVGDAMASLLLGLGTATITTVPPLTQTNQYYAFFVQDDINLTPKLALNLGLRYDIETGRKARENRLGWFDFAARNPVSDLVQGIGELKGGMRYQGNDEGRQYDNNWDNVAPRVGFAYSFTPKTVIRGGYGIFYPPFYGAAGGQYDGFTGFTASTQWLSSLDGVSAPFTYLSKGFSTGLTPPTGSSLGLLTNLGQNFGLASNGDLIVDRTMTTGYMQQWNVNIQRQLPGEIALELGYFGSKGTKLTYETLNINQLPPEQLQLGQKLLELVPNPFYGIIKIGSLSGPQVPRGQLLRPYPQFLDMNAQFGNASSIYHAFQMRVQRRFANGTGFLVSYTNSKLINDSDDIASGWGNRTFTQNIYNRRADRALSSLDVSQRLVASGIYELPFGIGKRFGSNWRAGLDAVLGHWQVNGILTIATGFPIALTAPSSVPYPGVVYPNVSGNPKIDGSRSTDEKLAKWFDTSVISQPAPFAFGNGPRTLPNVRGDGDKNFDVSVFKDILFFTERVHLQLRGEFMNALNSPRFGFPGTSVGTTNFGVVTGQANAPRQIQIALKLSF
jgi:hypothetical protein